MKLFTYPQLLTKRKKEAKKEKLTTTNNCQLFLGRDRNTTHLRFEGRWTCRFKFVIKLGWELKLNEEK